MSPSAPQRWKRLGRVYAPEPTGGWYTSHATYPTALVLDDAVVRVFFSVRDADNRSSIASVDLGIEGERATILGPVRGPLLGPGERGAFDSDGVTVGNVVRVGDRVHVYYLGWTLTRTVPFTNYIGLARGDVDGDRFERYSRAPVIGRSEIDPLCVGYPFVMRDGPTWRMWYGSHLWWGPVGLDVEHVMREATSSDGLIWTPSPEIRVQPKMPEEFSLSRPSVVRDEAGWSMWFACRYPIYRLGYAHSADGKRWERADERIVLLGEDEPWEVGEKTYPCVFDLGGRRYMLYNGAGYGRTGFGLAVLT